MKLSNTLAAVDDWKNETTVSLDVDSGGHGRGVRNSKNLCTPPKKSQKISKKSQKTPKITKNLKKSF